MTHRSEDDTSSLHVGKWPAASPDRLTLLVVGEGGSSSHVLPESGEVVLGRGDHADIKIDDPSISRRHAKLHLGDKILVEDLGSANGTVVRSTALSPGQRIEIVPGVAVELGSTVVIVQAAAGTRAPRARNHSVRPRRLMTHSYFEVRLEEACTQADATGGRFGLLRIHLEKPESDERAPEILVEAVRPMDVVAAYGPGEYEVFLADASPAAASEGALHIQKVCEGENVPVKIGIACYPIDGRTPETLMERAHRATQVPINEGPSLRGRIVVQDRVMLRLHRLIERVSQGVLTVLLLGETGVGKEVLAEAVHRASPRNERPFVKLNCAALTEAMFEAEIFGHEKNAYPGATRAKIGLLETAEGGTLFLDEVGEMPLAIQARLLRVIEDRTFTRVGSAAVYDVDVRFVSATTKNLEEEVARGRFKEDLYYRLNGIALVVPPLRERVSEVEAMAKIFAGIAAKQVGARREPRISPEAMAMLKSYSWPGNIRELRNVMERAVLLAADEEITADHLPIEKMSGTVVSSRTVGAVPTPTFGSDEDLPARAIGLKTQPVLQALARDADEDEEGDWGETTLESSSPLRARTKDDMSSWESERQRITEALERCAGNQSQAAKLLGMSRRTLVTRLVTHRIPRPRKPLPSP